MPDSVYVARCLIDPTGRRGNKIGRREGSTPPRYQHHGRTLPPSLGGINKLKRGGVLGSRHLTARQVVALLLLALFLPLHLLILLVHPSPLHSSPLLLLDLLLLPLVCPSPAPPQRVVVVHDMACTLLLDDEVAVGGRRHP